MDIKSSEKSLKTSEYIGLSSCFASKTKSFKKGEIITICSSNDDTIGIIFEGTVYMTTVNIDDQRRIIDFYRSGDIFCCKFMPCADNKCFYLTAKNDCKIGFAKYDKFIACCSNQCENHTRAITHLIASATEKSIMHIDILGQKSLRNKLLTFFEYLENTRGKSFELPLTLSDLADYLAVDRSAMMREIKLMNQQGIIISEKRKITLLF